MLRGNLDANSHKCRLHEGVELINLGFVGFYNMVLISPAEVSVDIHLKMYRIEEPRARNLFEDGGGKSSMCSNYCTI